MKTPAEKREEQKEWLRMRREGVFPGVDKVMRDVTCRTDGPDSDGLNRPCLMRKDGVRVVLYYMPGTNSYRRGDDGDHISVELFSLLPYVPLDEIEAMQLQRGS